MYREITLLGNYLIFGENYFPWIILLIIIISCVEKTWVNNWFVLRSLSLKKAYLFSRMSHRLFTFYRWRCLKSWGKSLIGNCCIASWLHYNMQQPRLFRSRITGLLCTYISYVHYLRMWLLWKTKNKMQKKRVVKRWLLKKWCHILRKTEIAGNVQLGSILFCMLHIDSGWTKISIFKVFPLTLLR